MPTGIRPHVNEAREFLEIARDFKDSREIMREALSNSWDANAQNVQLIFNLVSAGLSSRKKNMIVEILDDGEGIEEGRIDDFFSLGESHKSLGSIGTKGHGTKIYYKSDGIKVETINKSNIKLLAATEMPPFETLKKGLVPTYGYTKELQNADTKTYTKITVDGFDARPIDFNDPKELYNYILWYTVVGSVSHYFGNDRKMKVSLQLPNLPPFEIPYGFVFPESTNTVTDSSSRDFCKTFGPKTFDVATESGKKVKVEIVGAVVGEGPRSKINATPSQMGLWLCKDFIKISQYNEIINSVFSGTFYSANMLIFANCQQFELTANRNDILEDTEEYVKAMAIIRDFIQKIRLDNDYKKFQEMKGIEDKAEREEGMKREEQKRREFNETRVKQRLNLYKNRPIVASAFAPLREPQQEVEIGLLLQALIDINNPKIDFKIGEYNSNAGPDLVVESTNKGTNKMYLAEIVVKLENLFQWNHPPEGYEKIICWEKGKVGVDLEFDDGKRGHLTPISDGKYNLNIGEDNIEVYVLSEILKSK